MALTDIEQVRNLVGDNRDPKVLTDTEVQAYLDLNGGDVDATAEAVRPVILVAISTSVSKDRIGELWTDNTAAASGYLSAMKHLGDDNEKRRRAGAVAMGPSVTTSSPFSIGMFNE